MFIVMKTDKRKLSILLTFRVKGIVPYFWELFVFFALICFLSEREMRRLITFRIMQKTNVKTKLNGFRWHSVATLELFLVKNSWVQTVERIHQSLVFTVTLPGLVSL